MAKLIRKDCTWFTLLMVIVIALIWCGLLHAADVQKKLINFQGYLTDNANPPKPLEGLYDITFRIYESAASQAPLWTEQHESVTVTRGNVSVLLGSVAELDLDFVESRYLGIQVGTDPEMTPKQRLVPAFHALQATSSHTLINNHTNGTRSAYEINRITPIGLIAPYFGDPGDLPDNWMVCDGSVVDDPESPLNGKTLPNLTARFVRGEVNTTRNTADSFEAGGVDTHVHTIQAHNHTVTIQPDGSHTHTAITDISPNHTHNMDWKIDNQSAGNYVKASVWQADKYAAAAEHDHHYQGNTGEAGSHQHIVAVLEGGSHTHTASIGQTTLTTDSTSHLPSYVALHYIIRVK